MINYLKDTWRETHGKIIIFLIPIIIISTLILILTVEPPETTRTVVASCDKYTICRVKTGGIGPHLKVYRGDGCDPENYVDE